MIPARRSSNGYVKENAEKLFKMFVRLEHHHHHQNIELCVVQTGWIENSRSSRSCFLFWFTSFNLRRRLVTIRLFLSRSSTSFDLISRYAFRTSRNFARTLADLFFSFSNWNWCCKIWFWSSISLSFWSRIMSRSRFILFYFRCLSCWVLFSGAVVQVFHVVQVISFVLLDSVLSGWIPSCLSWIPN